MNFLRIALMVIAAFIVFKLVMDTIGTVGLKIADNTYVKGQNVGKHIRQQL